MTDESSNQTYRQPRTNVPPICGVNAVGVAGVPGSDGANVKLRILTEGWAGHADLPGLFPLPPDPSKPKHAGIATLGIILAQANGEGLIGLAHGANVRCQQVDPTNMAAIAAAITSAVNDPDPDVNLGPGDIMLLDMINTNGRPITADSAVAQAIQTVVGQGVIVIAPAGTSTTPITPSSAWIVAASDKYCGPLPSTGSGPGVTFFALGDNSEVWSLLLFGGYGAMTSLPPGDQHPTRWAAAIIAGAALSAQGMALATKGFKFIPDDLKALLMCGAGSQAAGTTAKPIGLMPDLIMVHDALQSDVFVRDFDGDTGGPHTQGLLYLSPDIDVVHKGAAADFPQAFPSSQLGAGQIELGEPNRFWVQVHNASSYDANNVVARVYWADPSTFNDPAEWAQNLIGQSAEVMVPANTDKMALRIEPDWVPTVELGHYCLIAVVSAASEPAPSVSNMPSAFDFFNFVQKNNNVAWRNCEVVNNDPDKSALNPPLPADGFKGKRPEEFQFKGSPPPPDFVPLDVILPVLRRGVARELTIEADLPPGSLALVHLPRQVVRATGRLVMRWAKSRARGAEPRRFSAADLATWTKLYKPSQPLATELARWAEQQGEQGIELLPISASGTTTFPISLTEGKRVTVRVLVHIPPEHRAARCRLAVIDHLNKKPIGRFTFWLAPDGRPGLLERLARIGRPQIKRPIRRLDPIRAQDPIRTDMLRRGDQRSVAIVKP